MKLAVFALAALLVGVGVGLGHTMLEFSGVEERFDSFNPWQSASSISVNQEPNVISIGENDKMTDSMVIHNFGVMERNTKGKYTFRLKNNGRAPLELTLTNVTCVCASTRLKEDEAIQIQPGDVIDVPLEWTPKEYNEAFRQLAEFTTNDPDLPALQLVLEGRISMSVRPEPHVVTFADVPAHEARMAEVTVFCYVSGDFKYVGHKFTDSETAEFFALEVEPLSESRREVESEAKGGLLLRIIKSGDLPLGPIQQTLQLQTEVAGDEHTFEIPIRGKVIGDVFIHTQSTFDQLNNLLHLPNIKQGEGHRAVLRIGISGPYKDDVEITIDNDSIDPPGVLTASLGRTIKSANGPTIYPLIVEISPDSPIVSRLGPMRQDYGKIVVKTSHPDAKEIVIHVRFAIEP